MFLFKKIVGLFFLPLSVSLGLFIAGLILLWGTKKKRTGKVIVSIGFALLAFFSYGQLPTLLLKPLENRYPPLSSLREHSGVRWIAVLGGGHISDPRIPVTSRLSDASLSRLVEGIRLHQSLPGSKLILSGGSVSDPIPEAKLMADVALALGLDGKNLILESISKDTEEEAMLIQKIVGTHPFILVTSASHMPRSMALFLKQGMRPIPAPTDYKVRERPEKAIGPGRFFPQAGQLEKAEIAIHEYLGLAWAKLMGRI